MKNRDVISAAVGIAAAFVLCMGAPSMSVKADTPLNGWYEENGAKYWYENGVRQGTEGRGKEIYDPGSDAWYWLDAADNGKMAVSKDVYQESNGGKWVRYDENGHMIKGWNTNDNGTYYFDLTTGAMYKGKVIIDGVSCVFDDNTGIGVDCKWLEFDGVKYWYEGGRRQGLEGRGKEIFDPASNAWYWLDAIDGGKMAVNKDVYQESDGGKWVRYDANGHMVKGENCKDNAWYRFDEVTGAMVKGWYTTNDRNGKQIYYYYDENNGKMVKGEATIGGKACMFDVSTGVAYDCAWYTKNGGKYWYEKGVRQGTEGRGKEIFDSASNAWYWLDAVDAGKMAVNKDVYQESSGGKWVRYDANGRMVKGWNTKDGKRYYFDEVTGAMAKGIVRIDGTDYSFDEVTGVYKGVYDGGEISYSWMNTKETRYDTDGNYAGHTTYEYTDNGQLERERTYNKNRRILTEEKYAYDTSGNVVTHSYKDYTDNSKTYTETYSYSGNLPIQVRKTDKNGTVTEVRRNTYSGASITRTDVYNDRNVLQYYCTYGVDGKGNVTKETRYDKNNALIGYTTNSYYEYGGQSFLRQTLEYNSEDRIQSGASYVRSGYELREKTIYTTNRVVTEHTKYVLKDFPEDESERTCQKESKTYDKNDSLIYTSTYNYERMEFLN